MPIKLTKEILCILKLDEFNFILDYPHLNSVEFCKQNEKGEFIERFLISLKKLSDFINIKHILRENNFDDALRKIQEKFQIDLKKPINYIDEIKFRQHFKNKVMIINLISYNRNHFQTKESENKDDLGISKVNSEDKTQISPIYENLEQKVNKVIFKDHTKLEKETKYLIEVTNNSLSERNDKEKEKIKIVHCIISLYLFEKLCEDIKKNKVSTNNIYAYLIDKSWLDNFKLKYNYYQIKNFLKDKYNDIKNENYMNYKKLISDNFKIFDEKIKLLTPVTYPLEESHKENDSIIFNYFDNYYFVFNLLKNIFKIEEKEKIYDLYVNLNIYKDNIFIIEHNPKIIEI